MREVSVAKFIIMSFPAAFFLVLNIVMNASFSVVTLSSMYAVKVRVRVHFKHFRVTTRIERSCAEELRLAFNGLHGVISQKIFLFIAAAVRTSDPVSCAGLLLFLSRVETSLLASLIQYSIFFLTETCSRYSDWLRAGQPRGLSSSPCKVKNFLHVLQTGSGVHPTSYPLGTGGKAAGE
jgi:hypothetical protein